MSEALSTADLGGSLDELRGQSLLELNCRGAIAALWVRRPTAHEVKRRCSTAWIAARRAGTPGKTYAMEAARITAPRAASSRPSVSTSGRPNVSAAIR